MTMVPLQLQIKTFFGDLHTFANNNRVMLIHSDDKNFLENVEKYGIRLLNQ